MSYIFYYFIAVNIISYILFGIDKVKATKNKWRIPEKSLFLVTFLGGTIGSFVAMKQFHHKTQKTEFKRIIYFIVFIQLLFIGIISWKFYTTM
ncbi:MAG: DUF1294 domain-containing protein [Flavobacteriaceae bacterium]|nr:DUF1294 domain-containing protein [Candidatus Onthonaster equi]